MCLAENEQDIQAISAYNRSLQCNSSNGKAVLALSISLTNEGIDNLAFANLEKWLRLYKGESIEQSTDHFYDNEWIHKVF